MNAYLWITETHSPVDTKPSAIFQRFQDLILAMDEYIVRNNLAGEWISPSVFVFQKVRLTIHSSVIIPPTN
jgi:hypothetical protein